MFLDPKYKFWEGSSLCDRSSPQTSRILAGAGLRAIARIQPAMSKYGTIPASSSARRPRARAPPTLRPRRELADPRVLRLAGSHRCPLRRAHRRHGERARLAARRAPARHGSSRAAPPRGQHRRGGTGTGWCDRTPTAVNQLS